MAIVAPISKYKKTNCLIFSFICLILALWFGYDGYINKSFIQEHSNEDGSANSTLIFNQKSPPFFAGAAALLFIYFLTIKNKKLLADENELILSNIKIPYDAIEKIDKTYFESKGRFTITYSQNNMQRDYTFSSLKYDNLKEILDTLVKKIS
jgi:hypothetical protein